MKELAERLYNLFNDASTCQESLSKLNTKVLELQQSYASVLYAYIYSATLVELSKLSIALKDVTPPQALRELFLFVEHRNFNAASMTQAAGPSNLIITALLLQDGEDQIRFQQTLAEKHNEFIAELRVLISTVRHADVAVRFGSFKYTTTVDGRTVIDENQSDDDDKTIDEPSSPTAPAPFSLLHLGALHEDVIGLLGVGYQPEPPAHNNNGLRPSANAKRNKAS